MYLIEIVSLNYGLFPKKLLKAVLLCLK